ncbi:rhodanese-like domain-containing protein [Desulfatiglans anilini]|uniref:rhodanese-like domain-containing protein n=1 Tax=Desulfatiglans anilini TaxID=90728 RepID=UPI0004025C2E|nr:rhodanese-like domain-containing protein [Desulfatiglans anilini]
MISIKHLFGHVDSLPPEEVKAFMAGHEAGTYTFLDVRQPGEYEKGHIPGARLIPLPELEGRTGELRRDQPLFVY